MVVQSGPFTARSEGIDTLEKVGEYEFLNDLVRLDTLEALTHPLVDYLRKTFNAQTVTVIRFLKEGLPVTLLADIQDAALHQFFDAQYARIGYMLDPFCIAAFGSAEFTAHQLREIQLTRALLEGACAERAASLIDAPKYFAISSGGDVET